MSCGAAPALSGGTSVVVADIATYTCNTGYRMTGSPNLECIAGVWRGVLPECSLISTNPTNNYWLDVFNNQDEIPIWLITLMGVAAGLASLFFLCCLLAFCLRLCRGSKVDPEIIRANEETDIMPTCCHCCRGPVSRRRKQSDEEETTEQNKMTDDSPDEAHKQANSTVFSVDNNKTNNGYQNVETQTKRWKMVREFYHQVEKNGHQQPNMAASSDPALPVHDLFVVERGRQKSPSRKIWKPHTRVDKNIFTITK